MLLWRMSTGRCTRRPTSSAPKPKAPQRREKKAMGSTSGPPSSSKLSPRNMKKRKLDRVSFRSSLKERAAA